MNYAYRVTLTYSGDPEFETVVAAPTASLGLAAAVARATEAEWPEDEITGIRVRLERDAYAEEQSITATTMMAELPFRDFER